MFSGNTSKKNNSNKNDSVVSKLTNKIMNSISGDTPVSGSSSASNNNKSKSQAKNNNKSKSSNSSPSSSSNTTSNNTTSDTGFLSSLAILNSKSEDKKNTPKNNNTPTETKEPSSDGLKVPSMENIKNASEGWFSFSYTNIFITLIVLALLGFNIFKYFGEIIDKFKQIFKPVLAFFGYYVGETSKQTINMAAEGSKYGIDKTNQLADSAISLAEMGLGVEKNAAKELDVNVNNKKKHNDEINMDLPVSKRPTSSEEDQPEITQKNVKKDITVDKKPPVNENKKQKVSTLR